jgi:hypothetical protein
LSDRASVYIETTVVSYLTARPSADVLRQSHQILTKKWWDTRRGHFELRTSAYTLNEAAAGDPVAAAERLLALRGIPILGATDRAEQLAMKLLVAVALPPRAALDAAHLAIAAVHGVDFLLTWNCTHLANGELTARIWKTCSSAGFTPPQILTPEMLMG